MANLVGKSWFPYFTSATDYENAMFVYSPKLEEDNLDLYLQATNLMTYSLDRIDMEINPSLDNLLNLAYREQQKEDNFLNNKCKTNRSNARTDGERIKDFNRLYQRIEIFNRNIKKIEAVDNNTSSAKIDITSVFRGYLTTEINKIPLENISEETLKIATKNAITKALSSKDMIPGEEEINQSYLQLLQELEGMADYSQFVDDVFDIYLKSSWKDFEKQLNSHSNDLKKVQVSGSRGLSGNLMEILSQRIMSTLGVDAKVTGGSGQKADLIVTNLEILIPDSLVYGLQSVRADFVKQWKNLYSNIKESGDIVEISAKNYSLGSTFQGFTAQDKVTIDNFAATLEQYGFQEDKINPLVYALLNIGPDTLEQKNDNILSYISTLIAYFLFDDIDMDLNTNVNAIHLFNLDGIYVPLSSFLFAAYNSLKDFSSFSKKYVSVSYTPKPVIPDTNGNLMETTWQNVTINKMDQQSISIHFFKDFTNYIKQLNLLH